jgi:nitroreductase
MSRYLMSRGFEMTKNTETPDYDHLYDILAKRMSIRRLRPDPIPDDYVHKILEAGRWAMSGANSQPWEFVVVKDEQVKRELFEAYRDVNSDFIFWMEQMREKPLRHPAYQVEGDNPKELGPRRRCSSSSWATDGGNGERCKARSLSDATRVISPTRSPTRRR